MASAYGWSKRDILADVFFEEALEYMEAAQRRKISDYLMQAYIASNPHAKKPGALFDELKNELRKLENQDIMEAIPEKGAFDKLRGILNKN